MKLTNKVVAVCGAKGSGKDSYFKHMQENLHGGVELINAKFAEPLNDFLDELCNCKVPYEDRDSYIMIPTDTFLNTLARHFPHVPQPTIITPYFHMTWRELAEWVGTSLVRKAYPDTFVDKLDEKYMDIVKDPDGNCVLILTDVRFQNELDIADVVVLLKREDDLRTEFNPFTPEPEKMGELIAVYINRYMIAGDLHYANFYEFLYKLYEELHLIKEMPKRGETTQYLKTVFAFQTMLDADGVLMYDVVQTASFGGSAEYYSEETIERWFEELNM